jgi:hypothetical protein
MNEALERIQRDYYTRGPPPHTAMDYTRELMADDEDEFFNNMTEGEFYEYLADKFLWGGFEEQRTADALEKLVELLEKILEKDDREYDGFLAREKQEIDEILEQLDDD